MYIRDKANTPGLALSPLLLIPNDQPSNPQAAKLLSVPGTRTCCGLGWNSGMKLASLKQGHKYGSWGPKPGDPVGYVYTTRAGLLDIGHIRDHIDLTKYVYDMIMAKETTIPCREGTAVIKDIDTALNHPIETAQAIAYIDSWSHELVTFDTRLVDFSAFSPEDLPSNFLGTYIGALVLRKYGSSGSGPGGSITTKEFNAKVDLVLQGILAGLGAQKAEVTDSVIDMVKGRWWGKALTKPPAFTKVLRRNFDSRPWFAGHEVDKPPAPDFIDVSKLTPFFKSFDYTSKPLKVLNGARAKHTDFPAITKTIRDPFKAAGTDRP